MMRRRVGYDKGGVVKPAGDRQTYVTGDDLAKQVEDRYEQVMEEGMPNRGYAQGGAVPRQNFWAGGGSETLGEWATQSQIAKAKTEDERRRKELASMGFDAQGNTPGLSNGPAVDYGAPQQGTNPYPLEVGVSGGDGGGIPPVLSVPPSDYARGGAVRMNFRGGGVPTDPAAKQAAGWGLWASEEKILEERRRKEAEAHQRRVDSQEQQRYNAMGDQEKRIYQVNYGAGVGGDYTTYQGTNDAVGGAGSSPSDASSVGALADYTGISASGGGGGGGGDDTGYAQGGVVRQNFRRGGSASKDEEKRRRMMQQAATQQGHVDAQEQKRYNALGDQEKRVYQLNSGQGIDGQGTTFRGINDAMGSAGRDPSDPSSVRALADTISARAGDYAEGGAVPEKWSSKVLMGAKKKGKGKKKQARTGFAEGGPVQNFDDGGGVYGLDDTGNATAYVPPQTDPMVEIARREAEERARMEAEQRAAQEAAQAQAAREAAAARTGARSMQQPGPQEPSEPQGPTPPANLPDQQARDELSARSAPAGQPPVGPRPPLVFPQVPGGGGGGGTSATDVMGNVTGGEEPAAPVAPPPGAAGPAQPPVDPNAALRANTAGPQGVQPGLSPDEQNPQLTMSDVMNGLREKYGVTADALQQLAAGQPQQGADPRAAFRSATGDVARTGYSQDPNYTEIPPPPKEGPNEGWGPAPKPRQPYQEMGDYGLVDKFLASGGRGGLPINSDERYAKGEARTFGQAASKIYDSVRDYFKGDHTKMPEQLVESMKRDPSLGNFGTDVQKTFTEAMRVGDREGVENLVQGVRGYLNNTRGLGQAAYSHGDLDASIRFGEKLLDVLPDGMNVKGSKTADGGAIYTFTPADGNGLPRQIMLDPKQLGNFLNSNASDPDHLLDNSALKTMQMLTQPAVAPNPEGMRVGSDGVPYREQQTYTGRRTDAGYPEDSPAGMMQRAEQADRRGERDPVAQDYANRAREAVKAGVAPEKVHDFLRSGGKAEDFEGPPSPPVPGLQRTPEGRLAYNNQYDIPGAGTPPIQDVATPGGRPNGSFAPSEQFDGSGRYKGPGYTGATERLHAPPDVIGPRETYQTGQRSSRESQVTGGKSPNSHSKRSDESTQALYPADRVNQPTGFEPYAYGERRAGYRAPTTGNDTLSASAVPPPAIRGESPPAANTDERAKRWQSPQETVPREFTKEGAEAYNKRRDEFLQKGDSSARAAESAFTQKATPNFFANREKQIAESNAAEKAKSADVDRIRNKYGYYTPELAAQDRAGNAPPIRYTNDWRQVPRPPTEQERAGDIANQRQNQQIGMKTGSAERIADVKTQGILTKTEQQEAGRNLRFSEGEQGKNARFSEGEQGKNTRASERETGRNARFTEGQQGQWDRMEYTQAQLSQRADVVNNYKDRHLQFLQSNAAQQIEQKYASDDSRNVMQTVRTKLQQGEKPNADEMDVYQQLLDRAHAAGVRTPNTNPQASQSFPALDAVRTAEAQTTNRGGMPMEAVQALRSNPSLKAQFDAKYGPGASERVLSGR